MPDVFCLLKIWHNRLIISDSKKPRQIWFPRLLLRHLKLITLLIISSLLASCARPLTREQTVATAYRYTQTRWMSSDQNIRHGPDSRGIIVHTPDVGLAKFGDSHGWWQPGKMAVGLPYQWGGFDTPDSFLKKIAAGKKAGDVGGSSKRQLGDAGTSTESCGIDCSGFVSRCWKLPRPYSTAELHQICDPLATWDQLLPGDILLNDKHVVLFAKWATPGKELLGYQAGPFPNWKVSSCGLPKTLLIQQGYSPWRYRKFITQK